MFRILWATAALLFTGVAASAQPVADAVSSQTSIKLTRVIAALPADKPWLSLKQDSLCIQHTLAKTWTYGRQPQELSLYSEGFKTSWYEPDTKS